MMQYVLVVMTSSPLPSDVLDQMDRSLAERNLNLDGVQWLYPDLAIEGYFEADEAPDLSGAFPGLAADIAVVPREGRRKKLLIADMDSTIITSESLDDLARLSGKGDEVAAITARSMRGELDFSQSLIERVKMIGGQDAGLIQTIIDEVTCNDGAETLVGTMNAAGARTILASGGFTFLTEVVAGRLGFDEHYANTLLVEDGRITGGVTMPILDQEAKRTRLDLTTEEMGITADEVVTVGDGANDRGMTTRAGLGVAYRGKDALKAVADATLDHADLRGLLWLQGYTEDELVTP
ncbi:MAG: phosphoserine phosphatase SerB [Alphaproteobacteria bacterium]|nr:phosphoserine phosphatase SerB [Alphaproteobacteria bacterium]